MALQKKWIGISLITLSGILLIWASFIPSSYHTYTHQKSKDWVISPPQGCAVGKQKIRSNLGAAQGGSIARGRTKLALQNNRITSTQGFPTLVKKTEIREGWFYSLVCKTDS